MATTALSGKNGTAVIGSSTYEVTQWQANLEHEMVDGTSFESAGWKEFVPGLQGATGSLTMIGGIGPDTSSAAVSLELAVSTTSGDLKITGSAFLQTRGASTPVDGRVEYTADFTFTGAVTQGTV
jgi:hypothetical protein